MGIIILVEQLLFYDYTESHNLISYKFFTNGRKYHIHLQGASRHVLDLVLVYIHWYIVQ